MSIAGFTVYAVEPFQYIAGGVFVMKLTIRRRMFFLVFFCVIGALLAVGAVTFYGVYDMEGAIRKVNSEVADYMSESMGGYAEKYAKARLEEVTRAKAQHLDGELESIGENAVYLADMMSNFLMHPENYRQRHLSNPQRLSDVVLGVPYIHYSPDLVSSGIGADLRSEIGIAGNFIDCVMPLGKFYEGYHTAFYAASEKGYLICLALVPGEVKPNSIYASKESMDEAYAQFDHRESVWYREGKVAQKPVFSDIYIGLEGYPDVTCVMPYYDRNGFAGVVGIDYSIEDLYRLVGITVKGTMGNSFLLDPEGEVLYSSDSERILSIVGEYTDLREAEEPSVAEAARRMTAGESGVMSVERDGDIFYLAFAPMESVGWSFGVVIEDDEVLDPIEEVSGAVREQMGGYQEILQQAMGNAFVRTSIILVPVLLLIFYGSGFMASRMARPIHTLAVGAQEIAAGNFDKKLEVHTGDEIEELADSFNHMTDELKKYMKNLALAAEEQGHALAELEVATRIQEDMLPNVFPAFPDRQDFDIYASMDAAKNVGGDFYDFYLADENHLVLTIADVSGKGVPAALFMAKSESVIKDCVLRAKSLNDIASILESANQQLCRRNDAAMFVTVFLGVLDLRNGHFVYGDAGHCVPFLGRNGRYEPLPMKKGSMLGLMELPYEQQSMELLPGDRLFLYTDGVSESMDENENQFTEHRILESLNEMEQQKNIKDILLNMSNIVKQHAGQAEQSDDITMLGLEYKGIL